MADARRAEIAFAAREFRQLTALEGGAIGKHLAHLKVQLDGLKPLKLPIDFSRALVSTQTSGAQVVLHIYAFSLLFVPTAPWSMIDYSRAPFYFVCASVA